MKKILIGLVVLVLAAGIFVYANLQNILQVSTKTILKRSLPSYITVEDVVFDIENGILNLKGLKIKNPKGYQNEFLVDRGNISCRYEMRGKTIFNGIEISEILADGINAKIDRRSDGRLNIRDMEKVTKGKNKSPAEEKTGRTSPEKEKSGSKIKLNMADLVSLPDVIKIRNGSIEFSDTKVMRSPYFLTLDEIYSDVKLDLSGDQTKVLGVGTEGQGILNGNRDQKIDWKVFLDIGQKDLTMSGRYEVRDLDLDLFRPYYDKYVPIVVSEGTFSGTLVFDLDHGNIGSTNTLILKGLKFREKGTNDGSGAWKDNVLPEILKYLDTAPNEVVFDFKIKGTMENPEFYPGPRLKEAIQGMVVNKITDALRGLRGDGDAQAVGEKSDVDRVVDIMRGFLKN
ncbi:MAG: DUF748 domain-containing protein [Candidatus Omnitrophota bacterium]